MTTSTSSTGSLLKRRAAGDSEEPPAGWYPGVLVHRGGAGVPHELVLHPSGDVDLVAAEGLRAQWYAAPDGAQPARVIVDLGDVPFMDAKGLSLFAGLANRQRARHDSIAVRHPPR